MCGWGYSQIRRTHAAERLVCLARWGVGYDRIDVPACTAAGVALTITPEGTRRPVAVTELGLILALALKLPLKDRLVREGRAAEKIYHFGMGLTGRTLGSLGIGNIGAELFRNLLVGEFNAFGYAAPGAGYDGNWAGDTAAAVQYWRQRGVSWMAANCRASNSGCGRGAAWSCVCDCGVTVGSAEAQATASSGRSLRMVL